MCKRHNTIRERQLEPTRSLSIPLPPLPEQRAIADMLDGVESAIELARTHVSILRSVEGVSGRRAADGTSEGGGGVGYGRYNFRNE